MEINEILFTFQKNICFIKFVGETRYDDCGMLNSFVNKTISENKCENFLFDLTESTYIDSTTLGIIARTGNYVVNKGQHKPIIFSTNNDINIVLNAMGFEDAFVIINDKVKDIKFDSMNKKELNNKEKSEMLLSAHKTLSEMNEKNFETFKNVVKYMEEEN